MAYFPPSDPLPPNIERAFKSMQNQIDALTARLNDQPDEKYGNKQVVFTYPGTPDTSKRSGVYIVPWYDCEIWNMTISAQAVGGGAVTVAVYLDDTEMDRVTMASGTNVMNAPDVLIDAYINARLQVGIVSAGSSVSTVTISLDLRYLMEE